MTDRESQDAIEDAWQTRLLQVVYELSLSLRELQDTNPWPEPVLGQAINNLATELWDRCFSLTEIKTAFEEAAADIPRYAAGCEFRP